MNANKPKLLCRIFGHRWKPAHVLRPIGWVYTDDVCTRCYMTEYRLPAGFSAGSQATTASDEQLDKERRRGWRPTAWVSSDEAELLTDRFSTNNEVGEINIDAWATLGSKADGSDEHG